MIELAEILEQEDFFLPGNASCPGCSATIGIRMALKVLGKNTTLVVVASCMSVIQSGYPYTSFNLPLFNSAFACGSAAASGIRAAMRTKGKGDANLLVWAGDGGTVDIGIQSLSGAAERGEDFVYVCYDNEAYMNTGTQRSGSTPYAAWTTTTPTGKEETKKDVAEIMLAHKIPYVATVSIGYPLDFMQKFMKARDMRGQGLRYIHFHVPCPPGWRYPSEHTVRVAKTAVDTGMWVLWEAEYGKMRITVEPEMGP